MELRKAALVVPSVLRPAKFLVSLEAASLWPVPGRLRRPSVFGDPVISRFRHPQTWVTKMETLSYTVIHTHLREG